MSLPPLHNACYEGDLELAQSLLAEDPALLHSRDEAGALPLHRAAQGGNVDLVEFLLDAGTDIEATDDEDGDTPLHWAALHGQTDIVRLLISRGANLNAFGEDGETPLRWAIFSVHVGFPSEIVDVFLSSGTDPNSIVDKEKTTHLHMAIYYELIDVVEMLLEYGADPNVVDEDGNTPAVEALRKGMWEAFDLIVKHGGEMRFPMVEMIASISPEVLKKRLVAEPHFLGWKDKSDWTLLHWAANFGRRDLAEVLLEAGSATGATNLNYGLFPIHLAARRGHTGLVDLFICMGVPVDLPSLGPLWGGTTPLQIAAKNNKNAETVRHLLNLGASVNIGNHAQYTALHMAAMNGNLEIVRTLVEHGADKEATASGDQTAADIAEAHGNIEVAWLL
ncbi:MAG: ankyrin repeat domain-containing protein [Candidatus Omnitrophica bacterium]|nr:ankyrin repeat domain-containing protein [Candidatus Omnitrophota bacterium]MCB9784997.1 ankyrin repeat domain-containing protein [Candidatus Omnitrophota bacterium]